MPRPKRRKDRPGGLSYYRFGAQPTVNVTMTLRPGSRFNWSPGFAAYATVVVGAVNGVIPTMLWLSKRLLAEKPILLPRNHEAFLTV
jgi:hypothetical protein